jgi:choline dehydrogenase-like flavoprotein
MLQLQFGKTWDAVVIGTGFGGSMVALQLARAGLQVLLLERGRWVDRDESAWNPNAILIERKYRSATPFEAQQACGSAQLYPDEVVGGNSVFYGAASFRLREQDFAVRSWRREQNLPEYSYVDWPISYEDLAPFYEEAEQLLGVAGLAGADPTEPRRASDYAQSPIPFSAPAQRVAEAARELGLHPFPIPLAINFSAKHARPRCVQCAVCDLLPCKIGAKNDLAVSVLPEAIQRGAVVRPFTIAKRVLKRNGLIAGVECLDSRTGETFTVRCKLCVVSAGAIASAKLLLASGLDEQRPNGAWIGRNLMRHCNGVVIGMHPFATNPEKKFHKQVGITDFYFGSGRGPSGGWGMIQGLQVAPPELIQAHAPFPFGALGAATTRYQTYLLCIAEDLPNPENRVTLDVAQKDVYGLPLAKVVHHYCERDLHARAALYREAGRILRRAGAFMCLRKDIQTFSHALGSIRFGDDPRHAALDPFCNFFGVPNLFVVDGSFMPSSASVNPSLTIAANALRVGKHIAENWARVVQAPREVMQWIHDRFNVGLAGVS